jgi:uncharacterized membrane protein YhaH (DUF805 family)
MLLPIKRWSDYRGRSRRKEYWSFSAFAALTLLVVIAFRAIAGDQDGAMADVGTVLVLAALVVFIPASIAAQVRRWHDRDVTGWACLISVIPYIGGIIVLIYMCMRGTKGPNRFGPDPTELS